MNLITIASFGVLVSIAIFGIKTGAGCGLSSIRKRDILYVAAGYLVISISIGYLITLFSIDFMQGLLNLGLVFHTLLALAMIAAGLYTTKKWNSGCDVSKRTFAILSLPCPVCLAAIFIACSILAANLGLGGVTIGIVVGVTFAVFVIGSSLLFKKLNKTPAALGDAMVFIGLFYILGAVLMPAYMSTKQIEITSSHFDLAGTVIPLTLLLLVIAVGFVIDRTQEH
ncbi:MAG: DUF2162 domain-containing protein [Euryarchaeota archaeon]|nr:DUF2162 domain-containing protein [Euryarchaeota archaeon]